MKGIHWKLGTCLAAVGAAAMMMTGCASTGSAVAESTSAEDAAAENVSAEGDSAAADTEQDTEAEAAEGTAGATESGSAVYPMTIKHALGETTLEKQPENVVAIGWGNLDVPLALGIAPTGVSKPTFGKTEDNGLFSWTNEAFKDLGVDEPNVFDDTDGLNFESIHNAHPDVILAAYSGISQEEYEQLSEIAPTVAYSKEAWATSWQEMTREDAAPLGKADEAEKLIAELEKLIREKAAEHPELQGVTAAYCYFDTTNLSSFSVYMPKDPRAAYLQDLGLTLPDEITSLDDGSFFFMTVSAENIDVLNNLDLIVAWGEDDTLKTMQEDSLISQVPAVRRGSVAFLSNNSALISASCTPTPLSIPATLEEYLDLLSGAAAKLGSD